jgi:hypothetical protein
VSTAGAGPCSSFSLIGGGAVWLSAEGQPYIPVFPSQPLSSRDRRTTSAPGPDHGEGANPREGIDRGLVTQRASCAARTNEIEPDPAVVKLDGWTTEPSPPSHDDPAHGGIEDRDEIALHIRLHANGCTKRQEVIGNVPVRCYPAQMEIAY